MLNKGFTFPLSNKECFIITEKKNITKELLDRILKRLDLPINPDTRSELKYYIKKATIEKKYINNNPWYSIKTDYSSSFSPENDIIIITL